MGLKVLVVDDSVELTEMFAEVVKLEFGAETTIVRTLAEALAVDAMQFDLALVDGNLTDGVVTGVDGRAVTNYLAARNPKIKLLGISGADYQPQAFWLERGAFRQKPIDLKMLIRIINQIMGMGV